MKRGYCALPKVAYCHPERRHHCRGMCLRCYCRDYAKRCPRPDWRKRNPERAKILTQRYEAKRQAESRWRVYYLNKHFGITVAYYNEMWEKQKGLCAICHLANLPTYRRLAVDHNHITGHIRGLLCTSCNLNIGMLDGADWFFKALSYLTTTDPNWRDFKYPMEGINA